MTFRSNEQKSDAIERWNNLKETKAMALKAVEDGDNTLKKAKHTYNLLEKFSEEVEKSSETAKVALENVPEIEIKVEDTQQLIGAAESVRDSPLQFLCIFNNYLFFRHSMNHTATPTAQRKTHKMLKIHMQVKHLR